MVSLTSQSPQSTRTTTTTWISISTEESSSIQLCFMWFFFLIKKLKLIQWSLLQGQALTLGISSRRFWSSSLSQANKQTTLSEAAAFDWRINPGLTSAVARTERPLAHWRISRSTHTRTRICVMLRSRCLFSLSRPPGIGRQVRTHAHADPT